MNFWKEATFQYLFSSCKHSILVSKIRQVLQPCNIIDVKIGWISPIYPQKIQQILNQVEDGKEDYCSSEHFIPNDY